MANRHLSRSIVLQTLYEWDFLGRPNNETERILDRNVEEFGEGINDAEFMKKLLKGVLEKQNDLDTIITKAAPDWPIEKISTVDRNILRLGLYELLFSDRAEVPPKVAINEAIELAKSFGGETSGRFVNGVLGAVYKEIGEPGKEQKSKRIKNIDLPDHQLPVEQLGGAIVYARDGEEVYLALVHDVFGHWTLSKGHIEEGETLEDGTRREMKEELGLDVELKHQIGDNSYIAFDPEKGKIKKHVVYFLAEAPFEDIVPPTKKGGLDDARWFKLKDILDLNFYDDILPIVTSAVGELVTPVSGKGENK